MSPLPLWCRDGCILVFVLVFFAFWGCDWLMKVYSGLQLSNKLVLFDLVAHCCRVVDCRYFCLFLFRRCRKLILHCFRKVIGYGTENIYRLVFKPFLLHAYFLRIIVITLCLSWTPLHYS